jgi:hypothetical protein
MAKPREPWNIRPAKKGSSLNASIKAEVEAKAKDLIDNVLKPKHVLPPPVEAHFNYITDIRAKWYRNHFYFFAIYACPGPNALSPTFESKVARMERFGDGEFALSFMRHTGEWVGIFDALSVDECMKAIQDDPGSCRERPAQISRHRREYRFLMCRRSTDHPTMRCGTRLTRHIQ